MMDQGTTIEQMEAWVRDAVDRHGDDGDRFALSGILEDRDRLRSQLASLIDLIRRRYPRLLERGNQMYDGLLADAVRMAEEGGTLNQANNEIDRLRARVAELEKQPRANELRALRNLFAAAGRTIHTASAGGRATLEEISDAWAEVCAAHVANRDLSASRVLGDGEVAVDEEELVALRCLDDAVTINGDGMSTDALGVDWEVARSAKDRLDALRAAKAGAV